MMCCGLEDFSVENNYDVKRLISSVLRKKRTNRIRKHPSMCVDAILASTLQHLKNDEACSLSLVSQSRCRKRLSQTQDVGPKKKSRWDVKVKCKKTEKRNEVDQELEDLLVLITEFLIPLA